MEKELEYIKKKGYTIKETLWFFIDIGINPKMAIENTCKIFNKQPHDDLLIDVIDILNTGFIIVKDHRARYNPSNFYLEFKTNIEGKIEYNGYSIACPSGTLGPGLMRPLHSKEDVKFLSRNFKDILIESFDNKINNNSDIWRVQRY